MPQRIVWSEVRVPRLDRAWGWFFAMGIAVVGASNPAARAVSPPPPTVTVVAGDLGPNPLAVGGTASATLSAYISSPPALGQECELQGDPVWSWTCTASSPDAPASPPGYTVSIDQPDPTTSDATLNITFLAPGRWTVTAIATITYTSTCGSQPISGTQQISWASYNNCTATPATSPQGIQLPNAVIAGDAVQVDILGVNGNVITNAKGYVVAGTRVVLNARVIPAAVVTLNNTQWAVPDSPLQSVSGFYSYTDQNGNIAYADGVGSTVPLTALQGMQVNFCWWQSDAGAPVSFTVTVGGQAFSAATTFEVGTPAVRQGSSVSYPGTIAADNQYNIGDPGYYLHFGSPNGPVGFLLSFVLDAAGNPGATTVVQVITKSDRTVTTQSSGVFDLSVANMLDTRYPAKTYTTTDSTGTTWTNFADEPALNLYPYDTPAAGTDGLGGRVNESFQTWVLWQPDGATSIPVPLYSCTWGWSGNATRPSLTQASWSLTQSSQGPINGSNSPGYPSWNGISSTQAWTNTP